MLFEHGFYLKKAKLSPDLHEWRYTGMRCGRDWSFRQCFCSRKRCTRIYDAVAMWKRSKVDAGDILFWEIKCKKRDI